MLGVLLRLQTRSSPVAPTTIPPVRAWSVRSIRGASARWPLTHRRAVSRQTPRSPPVRALTRINMNSPQARPHSLAKASGRLLPVGARCFSSSFGFGTLQPALLCTGLSKGPYIRRPAAKVENIINKIPATAFSDIGTGQRSGNGLHQQGGQRHQGLVYYFEQTELISPTGFSIPVGGFEPTS